jgi:hypothetical protein
MPAQKGCPAPTGVPEGQEFIDDILDLFNILKSKWPARFTRLRHRILKSE